MTRREECKVRSKILRQARSVLLRPQFQGYKLFFVDNLGWKPGISLGVHWAWPWRLDLHVGPWIISLGRVPVYRWTNGQLCAVSDSFHAAQRRRWRPSRSFDDLRVRRG